MVNEPFSRSVNVRVEKQLQLCFAVLSGLCGLILSASPSTETLPAIAIFFAVVGYLFVDTLKVFSLPPVLAYIAMAFVAVYCISEFVDLRAANNRQMVVVAKLLVFVQAILMLQRKHRHIYEYLGVFCLLELLVAAVSDDAIQFGLLLIPICIFGVWALSLLVALSATETPDDQPVNSTMRFHAKPSLDAMNETSRRLTRVVFVSGVPAALLIGVIFFYALPRSAGAQRQSNRGKALVGFSGEMRLEQIGHMMQSNAIALRMRLTNLESNEVFTTVGSLYLRGRVLEQYDVSESTSGVASWSAFPLGVISGSLRLPSPLDSSDDRTSDDIRVAMSCEPLRSSALFAVPPYFRSREEDAIEHAAARWTIRRREDEGLTFSRFSYEFATEAFQQRLQSPVFPMQAPGETALLPQEMSHQWRNYRESLTVINRLAIPTAARLAAAVKDSIPIARRSPLAVARALEQFLAADGGFGYTLNLNKEPVGNMDPIEQFLSVDREGHCQYFASAMVMMLRSLDIPARIVVGYHTDEFNELGGYYVARQSHAHAWVEALIDREHLAGQRMVQRHPEASQFWVRLDPTPDGGGVPSQTTGGMGQLFDYTQNVWDEYVVDMDAERQKDTLLSTPGAAPMSKSYARMILWFQSIIGSVRMGRFGGGALAGENLFSWPAAALAVVIMTLGILAVRLRPLRWFYRRRQRVKKQRVARPTLAFYADALDQIARVGMKRSAAQTPREFTDEAGRELGHPLVPDVSEPLDHLTDAYYRLRFGPHVTANRRSANAMGNSGLTNRADTVVVQRELAELTRRVNLILATDDSRRSEKGNR